jgi:RHS repeat-associated protein
LPHAGLLTTSSASGPKAYLNYLFFDRNFVFNASKSGFVPVTEAAKEMGTDIPHERLFAQLNITEPGYVYAYLSNDATTPIEVYFDDFTITHEQSPIVVGADYYPYGLVMDDREIDDEPYRHDYQGQYSEKDETTGYNEFQLRFYDAKIARWLSADPYGQYYSPYMAMGNMPNMGVDPDGGWNSVLTGALIGAGVGTIVGLAVDPKHWYYYTAAFAGLGALGGKIYDSHYSLEAAGIGKYGRLNGGNRVRTSTTGPSDLAPRNFSVPAIKTPVIPASTWSSVLRIATTEYTRPDDRPTWDISTNRRTRELHPSVSTAARQFINTVESELGIQLRITQGYRSIAEQDALYAQGRTTPGEVVTNARGGESYHNYGLAFDVVEMVNGRANWNTTLQNWSRIGVIGPRFGLEWGGNWTTFVDRPHFQITFGNNIRQLMQIHGVGPAR